MTPINGWGVRTKVDIPEGAFIATYSGAVISDKVIESRVRDGNNDKYYLDLSVEHALSDKCYKLKDGTDIDRLRGLIF